MSLLTGLIAYWPLDDGTKNTAVTYINARDATGAGYDGQSNNGGTLAWSESGPFGVCASSAGNSSFGVDQIAIPAINRTLSAATFTGWIYSNAGQNGYTGLFYSRASTNAPGFGISYGNIPTSQQLGYEWGANDYQWNSGLIVPILKWCFVAFVVNNVGVTVYLGSGGALASAVNAVSEASTAWNGAVTIGCDLFNTSTNRTFNGLMSHFGFWDRDLSPIETAQLYNNYQGLLYPFNVRRMGRPLGSKIIVP